LFLQGEKKMSKLKISIVSSCFNEEDNVEELCSRVKKQMLKYKNKYNYEQILVDNHSTDGTAQKLRELAKNDKHIKVILNARNFGHIRSPYWAMINATGDAIIYMASDLQDPPELIDDFIAKWEQGFKIVLAQKNKSEESIIMNFVRKSYYRLLNYINDSGAELIKNCTGFGLYDRQVVDIIKSIDDPYPFVRGIIGEIGFEKAIVEFTQPPRKKGKSKNNFYTLYDNAMLGIVKHSKVPLRLMTFCGFILSLLSLLVSLGYLLAKIIWWDSFHLGTAPILIGIFFFASVQLFFMGMLGEYIGAIYTRVDKKPVVVEKERINF